MVDVPSLQDLVVWLNKHDSVLAKVVGPGYYPSCVLDGNLTATSLPDSQAYFYQAEEAALAYQLWGLDPLVVPSLYATPPVITPGPGCVILPTPEIKAFTPDLLANMFSSGIPGALPVSSTATNLAGGAGSRWDDIATDTNGLQQALLLAETTQAAYVWVQSVAENVQNLLLQHAETMSQAIREKYRIFIGGINFVTTSPNDGAYRAAPDIDTAVTNASNRAPELNGPAVLCFNGTNVPNPISGQPEQLGGLGLSAQILGMAAGMPPGQPLTNKQVNSQGLEFPTVLDSQYHQLLQAGVLTPFYSEEDQTTNVLQALTCYQTNDPSFRLFQGLRIQHTVCRMWISILSKYKGKPLDLETGERIKTDCAKVLDNSILSGSNPNGFLTEGKVNGATTPAWTALSVTGDTSTGLWAINVNVVPVGETDYITVQTNFMPAIIQL